MDDAGEVLTNIALMLEEAVGWLRFMNLPRLRETLLKELDSDIKKLAYEMTDGAKSRRDIAQALAISDDNVQSWWQKWYELAIVRSSRAFKGRPQHIVSLEDVGIKRRTPTAKKEAIVNDTEETKAGERSQLGDRTP